MFTGGTYNYGSLNKISKSKGKVVRRFHFQAYGYSMN